MSYAAINIYVKAFEWAYIFISLYSVVEMPVQMVALCLTFVLYSNVAIFSFYFTAEKNSIK